LWADEGVRVEKIEVDRVLSILAFAIGPLESRDLLELMKEIHQTETLLSERDLLQPLRRFIIGDGKANSGYVLSHPKIAEYLQNERFGASVAILRRGFTAWGQKHLRSLNSGDLSSKSASPYVLQFLKGHFGDLSASEWMEFVENGWRCAWEQFDGVPRGFASDVQAAWDAVRRDPRKTNAIGAQWRCALVMSSIRSIGVNTPNALIRAAVANRRLSVRQAIHFVEIGRNGSDAVSLLLQLSQLDGLSHAESTDLVLRALETTHLNEEGRARALGSLAPHLSPDQIADALAAAKAIGDVWSRAHALGSLAPHLSPDQIADALAAAKAVGEEWFRARALGSLAPHLSPEQTADALAAAKAIGSEGPRAHALGSLAPHLSPDQIVDALAAAKVIGDEEDCARALGSLAGHRSQDQNTKTLAAAKAINNEGPRAEALGSLVPHLSPDQIADALAVAKEIGDEEGRALELGWIAPYLSPDQIADALAAAKEIGHEGNRADALGSLAPYLSPDQITDALAAAKEIGEDWPRAQALSSLALYALPIQYATLIDSLAETAAKLPRYQALATVSAFMHISAGFRSADGLDDIRRAISDTARWYP
jgi:hypothetical protein